MKTPIPLMLIFVTTLAGCSEDLADVPDAAIGMTQAQILSKFGEPDRKQSFTRTGGPDTDIGFGPPLECRYFRDLPGGSVVDVWYYDLPEDKGWLLEFHFIRGKGTVVCSQYLDEPVDY